MKPVTKNILITGTSTGIGYGLAKELLLRGYTIFGSVRKQEDADKLKTEFGEKFKPLLFDVTDDAAINLAAEAVKEATKGTGLCGLINNSGISVVGPVEHLNIERVRHNFDVNVLGLFRVTKAFLPLLGTQKNHPSAPGRVINISSVAGKLSAPFLSSYVSTKHAVEGFTNCLRIELLTTGIKVILVGPGPIQTPIWDKGGIEEFQNTKYIAAMAKYLTYFTKMGKRGMPLEECSRQIADILEVPIPKTRYAVVQGKFKNWTLPNWLPDKTVDNFYLKNFLS